MEIPTWKELDDQLIAKGISFCVREKLRILTAGKRHLARCQAAWQAALDWTGGNEANAAALCYCEARGLYGGGVQHPGAGTTRHEAFRGLGKGRRKASDGQAWTEAIGEAPQGWHHVGWLAHEDCLMVLLWGTMGNEIVDARKILAWHEIEVLVLGLVQDELIGPLEAAPILEWCRNRCEEEQHENQNPETE